MFTSECISRGMMVGINLEKLAWRQNSEYNADCIFYIVIF